MKFASSGARASGGAAGGQCSSERWVEPARGPAPGGHPHPHTPSHPPEPPDFGTGGLTVCPGSAPGSPPWASPSPTCLDPLCRLTASAGDDLGAPRGSGTPDSEPLLGDKDEGGAGSPTASEEPDEEEDPGAGECPICTESYGPRERQRARLHCGHGLCTGCLHRLLGAAPGAHLGRVCCPLCRQKTPMLEWEICRLQEELLQADGPQPPPPPPASPPPSPGPGPWAALEQRYRLRFLAGPVGGRGCLPLLPCPPRLGTWLWALRERGPCARRLALLGLLALELLGLLLLFTPLVLLGVLFVLLDRAAR
ncbi:LOW QUALITY PROTEIN: ring finger protein-like [Perognathus longimembris pacificus]|uniref:LOW QUALITY PROTEIN: ring finger protein-like n=1 Tax=Perognathus longimembris pacificus TaxID=214514 RepID=UPI00201A0D10|nr:LOW QUALITY PROTEIN: ring finger protein-like [Perognathus longimembris pacificus]